MTIEDIVKRLSIGPATTGELRRAGATDEQISGLVLARIAVILQHHTDPDAEIIGVYAA